MSRWPRLLILAFVTYSLAYLDRVNFGFGAAGGLAHDLHLSAGTASLLGAVFFLGYFIFQIPGGYYAEKRSARTLVFWGVLLWGIFAAATGLIRNIPLLFVDRFLLGVVESIVLPAMIVFLSHWFTRDERSRANTFLILGNPVTVLWASILSGYIIAATSWRHMFVFEGIPAIIWAFVWYALARNNPKDAAWMPQGERRALEAKLAAEQENIVPVGSVWAALKLPGVMVLSAQYFLWSVGIYGFVLWLPSILKNASGAGFVRLGWLSAVPYLVAIFAMLAASQYADRTLHRRSLTAVSMFVGAAAFFVSFELGAGHFWSSYVALIIAGAAMYAPYGPFFAMITDFVPRESAGAAVAMINAFGGLGGFLGAYLVGYLNGTTHSPATSYSVLAIALLLAGILTVLAPVRSTLRTPRPSPA